MESRLEGIEGVLYGHRRTVALPPLPNLRVMMGRSTDPMKNGQFSAVHYIGLPVAMKIREKTEKDLHTATNTKV